MDCRLLIFLIAIGVLLYIVIKWYNRSIDQSIENFTAISGIEQPLTTYDDYGTFNFLLQIDDFPYYDPTYVNMGDDYRDYKPNVKNNRISGPSTSKLSKNENFNKDSFINFRGVKVRRELIPANYSIPESIHGWGNNFSGHSKHNNYADADFDRNQIHLAIKKDRPRESAYPPQPYNIYFNKPQRVDPYSW